MYDKDKTFLRELCEYHVSGQLKVAPEHISNAVLSRLGKPSVEVYNSFVKAYKDMNKKNRQGAVSCAVSHVITPGLNT